MIFDVDEAAALGVARPAASVVIPHYGSALQTAVLVAKLRAQSGVDLEIIVSDDCSPQPYVPSGEDHVVRSEVNRGFGATVNRAVVHATHSWLLIMNSDLDPDPDFAARLLSASLPFQPAICSPGLIEHGGWGQTAYRFPSAAPQIVANLMPLSRFAAHPRMRRWQLSDPLARPGVDKLTDWVAGACMLLRTSDFRRVGGFDEGFYMYGEDTDLCRRLASAGVPSVVIGSVPIEHEHGASSDPGRIARWNAHARFRYARKWGFRGRLAVGLAAAAVINLAYNVLRRAAGKDIEPVNRFRYELGLLRFGLSDTDPRTNQ